MSALWQDLFCKDIQKPEVKLFGPIIFGYPPSSTA